MVNMDKLLKKKGWTGEELGRLAIANLMLGYKKALETNNPDEELPIKQADFDKMLGTLKDPVEGRIYNGYIAIHEWVTRTMQVAIAQEQQAQLQYDKFLNILTNAITAEDIYSYIASLPLIMTEKQYKDTVERRKQEILKPEDGIEDNILQLVFTAIEHYIRLLQTSPQAKNPLKPLKKKLQKDTVTDPHILDRYNIVMGNGYYTLEDGTRSDSMTPAEWRALVNPLVNEYFKKKELGEVEAEVIRQQVAQRRLITDASIMFHEGVTEEEAERIRAEREIKEGLYKKCEWHFYEDTPTDLTKWEVLETDIREYYDLHYFDNTGTGEDAVELAKAFVAEYPEVTKAMLEDIAKKYPALKYVKEVPVEKWLDLENCPTWETLYKLDFYGFKSIYTDDTAIFDGNKRALSNGIAILKPSEFSQNVDKETGYYTAPDIRKTLADFSLEGFFTESDNYAERVEDIEEARELFIASVYFIRAFNKCLDLIASMYDIEEVKIAQAHVSFFEEKVEALNGTILMLYKRIANTVYDDAELREKKLGVLKDIFYPIDLKKTILPKKRVERTKEAMRDFKAFKEDRLNPTNLLCLYDPEAIEEELEAEEDGEGV